MILIECHVMLRYSSPKTGISEKLYADELSEAQPTIRWMRRKCVDNLFSWKDSYVIKSFSCRLLVDNKEKKKMLNWEDYSPIHLYAGSHLYSGHSTTVEWTWMNGQWMGLEICNKRHPLRCRRMRTGRWTVFRIDSALLFLIDHLCWTSTMKYSFLVIRRFAVHI